MADGIQIQQVLLNLISNAIDSVNASTSVGEVVFAFVISFPRMQPRPTCIYRRFSEREYMRFRGITYSD